jgi:cell division protease FtsH
MWKIIRNILITLILFLLITAGISALSGDSKVKPVSISEIVNLVNGGRVESVEVDQDRVVATVKESDTKLSASLGQNTEFITLLKDSGVSAEGIRALQIEYKQPGWGSSILANVLPILLPFLLISLFIYFLMRQVQGTNNRAMSFGQSSVKLSDERKNKVRFADVAGAKEAKEELREVVEFLRFPQKFLQLGAKIPKGVLLLGSPGVGKTLLARAVAGEANVPFFHISGSEFVEMVVGVGASRVRDLFRKAKRNSPCIVFIDEIDAVGRQRGTGLGGGHDEREQTLNQILVEMDGFETETNVIVIAATNRPDVLDPALLRPGRFDRQVVLDLPDIKDREEILKVHAKGKPLAEDVNLRNIAERTPGFSGADLANLLNEGAILAARGGKKDISTDDLREAIEKVMLGPKRASHILSTKEKEITAYHEGGHALVGAVLPEADPVHKVTILSRGRAAGYTMKLPSEEKHMQTRASFLDEIAALLGGYAAEKLVFSELTTGASNDLKVATNMARKLVTAYGMSDSIGPVTLAEPSETVFLGRELGEHKNYSETVATQVDGEISRIMSEQLTRATKVLNEHRAYLDTIAKRLVADETLEQEQFYEIVKDVIPAGKARPTATQLTTTEAESVHVPAPEEVASEEPPQPEPQEPASQS